MYILRNEKRLYKSCQKDPLLFPLYKKIRRYRTKVSNSNHSNNNRENQSRSVRFPMRTLQNSMLFISKTNSVTKGFLVRNGLGVSWRECQRNLKQFWSPDQDRIYYGTLIMLRVKGEIAYASLGPIAARPVSRGFVKSSTFYFVQRMLQNSSSLFVIC